jgi:hypothetical protein
LFNRPVEATVLDSSCLAVVKMHALCAAAELPLYAPQVAASPSPVALESCCNAPPVAANSQTFFDGINKQCSTSTSQVSIDFSVNAPISEAFDEKNDDDSYNASRVVEGRDAYVENGRHNARTSNDKVTPLLGVDDEALFGASSLVEAIRLLHNESILSASPCGPGYWSLPSVSRPCYDIDIRNIEQVVFRVLLEPSMTEVDSIVASEAFFTLYEGAVYLYQVKNATLVHSH